MKTFISPGSWFSFDYPDDWFEFEEESDDFLFYNPDRWSGNFRISASRDTTSTYAAQSLEAELRQPGAKQWNIGTLSVVETIEHFREEGQAFVCWHWLTGMQQTVVECSFVACEGEKDTVGRRMLQSLVINAPDITFHHRLITLRVAEALEVDDACMRVEQMVRKLLKARFSDFSHSLDVLQQLAAAPELRKMDSEGERLLGFSFCSLLVEELEGYEWRTYIDGTKEEAVVVCPDECILYPTTLFSFAAGRLDPHELL